MNTSNTLSVDKKDAKPYEIGMDLPISAQYVSESGEAFKLRADALAESVSQIVKDAIADAQAFADKQQNASAFHRLQDMAQAIGKHRASFAKLDGKEGRPLFPKDKALRVSIMERFATLEKPFKHAAKAQADLMRSIWGTHKEESSISLLATGGLTATTKQTTKIVPKGRRFERVRF